MIMEIQAACQNEEVTISLAESLVSQLHPSKKSSNETCTQILSTIEGIIGGAHSEREKLNALHILHKCIMTGNKTLLTSVSPKVINTLLNNAIYNSTSSSELKQNALFAINEWGSKFTFVGGAPSEFYKASEKLKKAKYRPPQTYLEPWILAKKYNKPATRKSPEKKVGRKLSTRSDKSAVVEAKELIYTICKRIDFWVKDKAEFIELGNKVKVAQKQVVEETLAGSKEKDLQLISKALKELPLLMSNIRRDDMSAKLKLVEIHKSLNGATTTLIQSPVIKGLKGNNGVKKLPDPLFTPKSRPTINDSVKVSQKKLGDNESPEDEEYSSGGKASPERYKTNAPFGGISLVPTNTNEWFTNVPSGDIWSNAPAFDFTDHKEKQVAMAEENTSELAELETQVSELLSEKTNLQNHSYRLENENKELLRQYEALSQEYSKTSTDHERILAEMNQVLESKRNELEDKRASPSSAALKEELQQNKAQWSKLNSTLKAAQEELNRVSEQNSNTENELNSLLKQEAKLKAKLKSIESGSSKTRLKPLTVPELGISPIQANNSPLALSSEKEEEKSERASSGSYKTPPQVFPGENVSPPVATEFKVSPTVVQTNRIVSPEGQGEARYKACLTASQGIWHEDAVILIKISRLVNVPMKSAAYKVTFENKLADATLHIKRFEPLAYDSKGILRH